jgi:hypothetical protein
MMPSTIREYMLKFCDVKIQAKDKKGIPLTRVSIMFSGEASLELREELAAQQHSSAKLQQRSIGSDPYTPETLRFKGLALVRPTATFKLGNVHDETPEVRVKVVCDFSRDDPSLDTIFGSLQGDMIGATDMVVMTPPSEEPMQQTAMALPEDESEGGYMESEGAQA